MKHAVLIMAHNNFNVVSALISQCDMPEIDIYIHINKKVRSFPREEWQRSVKNAGIFFVPRVKVGYCDYSMVDAVVSLFRSAYEKHYDYYHLVSGADLMVAKREAFLGFFEKNNRREFVGFSDSFCMESAVYRNFFTAKCRQKSRFLSICFTRLRKGLISVQKTFGIKKRIRYFAAVKKGTDWYSVTDRAVGFLLEKEPLFKKDFFHAYCPTEFFAQTVLYNSQLKDDLYVTDDEGKGCLRYIDWERGLPYTFTYEDRDMLISSGRIFARKFDENKDMKIVAYLTEYVKEK